MLVSLMELNDPAAYVLQAGGEQFRRRLTLTYDGKKISGPLEVEVSTLDTDSGLVVEPVLALPIAAGASAVTPTARLSVPVPVTPVSVDLSVRLPRVGDYIGYLRFKLGNQDYQYKRLRITRAAPVELPVEVSPQQRLSGGFNSDLVTFTVKGLVDRSVCVTPTLFGLSLKNGANATFEGATFNPASLDIPPGGVRTVTMTLNGLGPGEYLGKVTLASEAYRSKEHSFVFGTRYGWWWAFLLTALGAVLSLCLKRLSSRERPRLVVRTAVSRLLWQAHALGQKFMLEHGESELLFAICARIRKVYDEAMQPGEPAAEWSANAKTSLTTEGSKLSAFADWVNSGRALKGITGLDKALRDGFEARLDRARQSLRVDSKMEAAALADVANLPGDIEREKDKLAQASLIVVTGEIARQVLAGGASDPAKPMLDGAKQRVEQANELLAARNYAGFRLEYAAAGVAYYQGLGQRLEAKVAQGAADAADVMKVFAPGQAGATAHLQKLSDTDDLEVARTHYDAAVSALQFAAGADVMSIHFYPGQAQPPGDVPDSGIGVQMPEMPPVDTTFVENTSALLAKTEQLDMLIDWFAVGTSGLLGVMLVWSPNLGWGQPSDLLAAILWGLGLQQVGVFTFEGILGLRTRLSSP